MSISPTASGLGEAMRRRRERLRLSRARAARDAGVARSTWIAWEDGRMVPGDANRAAIERVLDWEAGSVSTLVAVFAPAGVDVASVTPIRAEVPADEAELAAEWRDMGLPEPFVAELIDAYRAEKAGLRERFRYRARETGT